jgi:hypothetical protein
VSAPGKDSKLFWPARLVSGLNQRPNIICNFHASDFCACEIWDKQVLAERSIAIDQLGALLVELVDSLHKIRSVMM